MTKYFIKYDMLDEMGDCPRWFSECAAADTAEDLERFLSYALPPPGKTAEEHGYSNLCLYEAKMIPFPENIMAKAMGRSAGTEFRIWEKRYDAQQMVIQGRKQKRDADYQIYLKLKEKFEK